jgi:TRAP-type C4-dicarboxylate transport system permease small subunit
VADEPSASAPRDDASRPGGLVGLLLRVDRGFALAERAALFLVILALVGVAVYQSLRRHFFPPSPFWVAEIVRYSVFFLGLVGAALATHSDRLFNIDLMARILKPSGRLVVRLFASAFTAIVCAFLITGSLSLRALSLVGEKGEVIDPPVGVLILPVAMGLIIVHLAIRFVVDLTYLVTGKLPVDLFSDVPKA